VKQAINEWVSGKTNGLIPKLFDSIDPLTRLALVNAVYFNAKWQTQFNPDETSTGTFHGAKGEAAAPFMTIDSGFKYYENAELQLIQLPYSDTRFAMTIVLPKQSDGLAALDRSLTAENLAAWINAASTTKVGLSLPRFTISSSLDLKPTLSEMGMPEAFGDRADFSSMTDAAQLKIDQVVHKAVIRVGEKGTEAAAATGATMTVASVSPVPATTFNADHPFYFAIQNTQSGAVLFSGAVTQADPA
jgi:serpin B